MTAPMDTERGKRGAALEKGALVAGTTFALSIVLWVLYDEILINPFVSLLGLVASPFFWGMGRVMRNGK